MKTCKRCGKEFATGGPYGTHVAACGGSKSSGGRAGERAKDDAEATLRAGRAKWRRSRKARSAASGGHEFVTVKGGRSWMFEVASRGQPYWLFDDGGGVAALHRGARPPVGRSGRPIKTLGRFTSIDAADRAADASGLCVE